MRRIHEGSRGPNDAESDNMAEDAPLDGRAVHPYRDPRDALVARRRALARELADAERAAAKRARVARALRAIDRELGEEARRDVDLDAITIPTRCRASWRDMRGDDAVRRCPRCERDVYDLAQMTRAEIDALLARAEGTPCVRLRRRSDGRVVTADCPPEPPSLVARGARAVAAGVLFGAGAVTTASLLVPLVGVGGGPVAIAAPVAREPAPREIAPRVEVGALRSTPEIEDEIEDEVEDDAMGAPSLAPVAGTITREDLDRHVRWIAPQAWELDRELVDRMIASTATLHPTVRVIPHEERGRVVGVRLFGVRRDSVLGRLGVQNGDTLLEVNGVSMASPEGALGLYARLHSTDALFVRLSRRGEELVHVYRIVG